MHNPQDSLNATLELSQSLAAAAAAQEQKSSIDVLSVPISQPNMKENAEIISPPFLRSTMQGGNKISKNQSLPGSPGYRLPTVAGSNRTATNTELPSTNGSLPETKTKGTVRIILFFSTFGKLLVWWQQKQKIEPLILKMYT